ncbi:fimbria/pilus outer membrane usher protein [Acinetobacter sp. 10FS3-1]|uniref:fimbria/pilus outer membrane usher protein n=1 Tax=Acinetobacter sp. 10FS3-1 TaxID=2563897 RepID=UPI00157BC80D|nr:fimbria/pilus outer membrane usher protein [Acinetobacter sp. 10FS3-1]QKQ69220.1 fimbrial biogenesis outer membrane usher protein [Acinetobacter sp. 10FS3-1]
MKATKILIMIVCGMGVTNTNAIDNQQVDQKENVEIFIVNIWVNGLDYNTETTTFIEGGKRFIECEALNKIGIRIEGFQHHLTKKDFCLLNQPDVIFEDDHSLQAIKINFPSNYFQETAYDLEVAAPEKANFGGFVNYSLFYNRDEEDQEFNTFSEVGIFKDYWLFKNAFLYRKDPEEFEQQFLRVNSTLDIEFPEKFLSLTLGDTTSRYNALNNSFRFGGLSFGTNYTDRPDFVYWNTPTLNGSASLPSTIDLYINGIRLYRDSITPGNYNLPAGAIFNQAGDAQVVVEDILGNRTVQSFPIYINSRLLKPKLNEYNISLGKLRYNYDYVDDDYRDFFTKVFFRRGITSSTTLGGDLLYSEETINFDFLWTQGVSKYFVLDTAFSVSEAKEEEEQGYAASLVLSRSFKNWSYSLNSRYFTEEYKYLSNDLYDSSIKTSSALNFNFFNLKIVDGVGFNYIYQSYYNDQGFDNDRQIIDIRATKRLTKNLYSDFGFFKDFGEGGDQGFNIAFNYDWGDKGQIYLDHDTENNETSLSYSHRTMTQNGFDYVLGVNRSDDEVNYNAYGLWKTSIGNLQLSHDEFEDRRNSQALFEGALVWLGNKVALTKYAYNAFALVNVDQHPNLDIYRSATLAGHTNDKGYIFIHDIIPYIHYDISFDQNQLAMDETFEYSSKKLIALDQRGYKFNFPVHKTKRIAVKIKDIQQNNLIIGSEVLVDGLSGEPSFVDSQGIVYLYLFKAGSYNLKVKTQGGKQCQAQFTLNENQFQNSNQQVLEAICE